MNHSFLLIFVFFNLFFWGPCVDYREMLSSTLNEKRFIIIIIIIIIMQTASEEFLLMQTASEEFLLVNLLRDQEQNYVKL